LSDLDLTQDRDRVVWWRAVTSDSNMGVRITIWVGSGDLTRAVRNTAKMVAEQHAYADSGPRSILDRTVWRGR